MKITQPYQQKGAALIMVLGLVATITILVTQLMEQVNERIRHNSSLKDMRQAYWYALASEKYALSRLKNLVSKKQLDEDDLTLNFPINKGLINYRLHPLHSCLNLNSLVHGKKKNENAKSVNKVWQRFLHHEKRLDISAQEKLINRVKDWVDSDRVSSLSYGLEAQFYSGQAVAQLPSNQPLITTGALEQMDIVPDSELPSLLTQLCSRPGDTELSINPQDLKEEQVGILASVLQGTLEREEIRKLIVQRPQEGYKDLEEFWQQIQLGGRSIQLKMKSAFSLKRRYFELQTQIQLAESQFGMSSWLYINSENKTRVLARRYGAPP